MQTLMLSLFVVVFSLDYLANIAGMVHPLVTLAPELLSGVATLLLCGHLARTKRFDLHIKYVIFFALFGMHLLNGVIINETPTGAVVAGLRVYLKYLPFFFLPVVYEFTPRQLRVQMLLLLGLLVCQLPITVLQRFVFFPDYATGDVVRGTLTTGSFLSIILVSAISVLLGLYLKRIISGAVFG